VNAHALGTSQDHRAQLDQSQLIAAAAASAFVFAAAKSFSNVARSVALGSSATGGGGTLCSARTPSPRAADQSVGEIVVFSRLAPREGSDQTQRQPDEPGNDHARHSGGADD